MLCRGAGESTKCSGRQEQWSRNCGDKEAGGAEEGRELMCPGWGGAGSSLCQELGLIPVGY